MFERYSEKARSVIYHARHFASELGCHSIEPEHILLAILKEDPDIFRQWLQPEQQELLRSEIESAARGAHQVAASTEMRLSHSAKRVLAQGAEEAERQGHRDIRPAHLLSGLAREQDSTAAAHLRKFGVDIQKTRLFFVASSNGAAAFPTNFGDVHTLVDQLPASQLGRARALLQALLEADRTSGRA